MNLDIMNCNLNTTFELFTKAHPEIVMFYWYVNVSDVFISLNITEVGSWEQHNTDCA